MRILPATIGAIAGAIVGWVVAFFVATLAGGGNDLSFAFLAIYWRPRGAIIGALLGAAAGLLLIRCLCKVGSTRSTAMFLASVTVVLSVAVGAMLWTIYNHSTPPSDQKLFANFERHEATFTKLVERFRADKGLNRIDDHQTDPKDLERIGVSETRVGAYRRMLKDVRAFSVESEQILGEIDFYFWAIGSA